MRHWLPLLLSCCLMAAEIPDPTRDLTCRSLITDLASLRKELAAHPDSRPAWAAVVKTYALLAAQTEPAMWGAYGPWYDYARQALAQLEVRRNRPAAAWEEALPALWVRAVAHDDQEIIATLDRLQAPKDHPEVRALHAIARQRPEETDPPRSVIERHAWSSACCATGGSSRFFRHGLDATRLDPWGQGVLAFRTGASWDMQPIIRAVYRDTAWMLQSVDLDDATAVRLLTDLVVAAGGAPEPADRGSLFARVQAQLASCPLDRPEIYIASYRACLACLGGKCGWDGDRPTGLVGLGDVARWNRDRHYLLITYLRHHLDDAAVSRTFLPAVATALGDCLPVARGSLPRRTGNKAAMATASKRLHEALRRDLALPAADRFPPAIQGVALARIAEFAPDGATDLADAVAAGFATAPGDVPELVAACRGLNREELSLPLLTALVRRSPWNGEAAAALDEYDAATRLFDGLTPDATWDEATIDFTAVRQDRGMAGDFTAMRWTGALTLPQPGDYGIAIESDDGSRLRVGRFLLRNDGDHGMRRVQRILASSPAALPLELEWYNRASGLGCRLLWQPPGTTDWTPVPASALSHDGRPGLAARLYHLGSWKRLDTCLRRPAAAAQLANRFPDNRRLVGQAAEQAVYVQDWPAATESCRRGAALADPHCVRLLPLAMLMQDPPLAAEAGPLLRAQRDWWCEQYQMGNLLHHTSRHAAAVLAALPGPASDYGPPLNLLRGECALMDGDLAGTLEAFQGANAKLDWFGADCGWKKEAMAIAALLERQRNPRSDLSQLPKRMRYCCQKRNYLQLGEWLAGTRAWPAVADGLDDAARRDLEFYRALYLLTIGEHAAAQAALRTCTQDLTPTNTFHTAAQGILAWYARQSPAELAALPKAPPLDMGGTAGKAADPAPPPPAGAQDF